MNKYKDTNYMKKYYINNKHKLNTTSTAYLNNNPQKYLWYTSKTRAKKANLEFTIQPEDIIIPEYCPYLNIKFVTKSILL